MEQRRIEVWQSQSSTTASATLFCDTPAAEGSDGISEARSIDGEEFGRNRLGDLAVRAAAANYDPPETMRLLGHAVLAHQLGVLQDDATLLVLVWNGPPGPARATANGRAAVKLPLVRQSGPSSYGAGPHDASGACWACELARLSEAGFIVAKRWL